MPFITQADKDEVDAYVNGNSGIFTAKPCERHKSMLNFLIGYAPRVVIEAMQWHAATYPNETLER